MRSCPQRRLSWQNGWRQYCIATISKSSWIQIFARPQTEIERDCVMVSLSVQHIQEGTLSQKKKTAGSRFFFSSVPTTGIFDKNSQLVCNLSARFENCTFVSLVYGHVMQATDSIPHSKIWQQLAQPTKKKKILIRLMLQSCQLYDVAHDFRADHRTNSDKTVLSPPTLDKRDRIQRNLQWLFTQRVYICYCVPTPCLYLTRNQVTCVDSR